MRVVGALTVALAVALGFVAGFAGASGERVVGSPQSSPTRFACYSAQFSVFRPQTRTVTDTWSGTATVSLYAPDAVCAPAPGSSTSYLTCYRVKVGATRFVARTLTVVDEFARPSHRVRIYRLLTACVPSSRVDTGGSSVPARGLDPMSCYLAKSSLSVRLEGVVVQDDFGRSSDSITTLGRLCAPASLKGARPVSRRHTTCYTDTSATKGASAVIRNELGFLKAALGPRGTLCTAASVR